MGQRERRVLNERQKAALYDCYLKGEKVGDLADAYQIAQSTAYRYISEQRGTDSDMASKEKVIAGNKMTGRCIAVDGIRHKYRGEHKMPDGRMEHWNFTAMSSRIAIDMWEKWCRGLDDEDAFMGMVERRNEPADAENTQDGTPYTSDEEVAVDSTDAEEATEADDSAHESQTNDVDGLLDAIREKNQLIEVLSNRVAELQEMMSKYESGDWVSADIVRSMVSERDALKMRVDGLERVLDEYTRESAREMMAHPAYLIWAKTDTPKCYGLYATEDHALAEIDRLNDIAVFFGKENVFEIDEVAWKEQ